LYGKTPAPSQERRGRGMRIEMRAGQDFHYLPTVTKIVAKNGRKIINVSEPGFQDYRDFSASF